MTSKKVKKAIVIMIVAIGTYCFLRIPLLNTKPNSGNKNTTHIMKSQILATHISIPYKLKGKRLPFHRIYEPRQVGLTEDLQTKNVSSNKIKLILLWTPWNGVTRTINYYSLRLGNSSFVKYNCPNRKCTTSRNRTYLENADAVLFHLLDTKSSDLPVRRNSKQLWILYNMEPPWLVERRMHSELPYFRNVFNWTMSYRKDSDLQAKYGFISQSPEEQDTRRVPFEKKNKNIAWFVSDCPTDSKREDYVNELRKHIDVDIYGRCGELRCYPAQSTFCYKKILDDYKFYLSFENALCKDYVTEKFFNVFNYDIIPVVFGSVNYSLLAPEGTFIDATRYPDPKELAKALLEIGKSEELYESFISKKRFFVAYLDPWMCRLCEKLHSTQKASILEDVERWWLNEAHCQMWNKFDQSFEIK